MPAPPHRAGLASCALGDWTVSGDPEYQVTISRPSLFFKTLPEPSNRVIYDIFGDSKYKNVLHRMARAQKRIRRLVLLMDWS